MKIKYNLGLALLSVFSLLGVVWATPATEIVMDHNFFIDTISGDPSILDPFEIRGIVRNGPNHFSQITITSEGTFREPTIFDERFRLNEEQLQHRELFRHIWDTSNIVTAEGFQINHSFDSRYIWQLRYQPQVLLTVLDEATGNVSRTTVPLPEIPRSVQIWEGQFVEETGILYYVLQGHDSQLFIFQFDPLNLTFEHLHTTDVSNERANWAQIILNDQGAFLFLNAHGETDQLEFYEIELRTGEITPITVSAERTDWWWVQEGLGNYFVLGGSREQDVHLFDTESGVIKTLPLPTVVQTDEGGWLERQFQMIDAYLIQKVSSWVWNQQMQTSHRSNQQIIIYDLETLEIVFEGVIPLDTSQDLVDGFRFR